MSLIRILIVDDNERDRDGLRVSLMDEDGIEIVGEATNGAEALAQVAALKPDVILMDLRMPIMNGVDATRQICETDPHPQVVVLTTYDTEPDVGGALKAGAAAYQKKDAPTHDLLRSIRGTVQGGASVPKLRGVKRAAPSREPASFQAPQEAPRRPNPHAGLLDEDELEVLRLIAGGYNNSQAAYKLAIEEDQVKAHLFSCYRKLGKQDRSGAVGEAHRRNLL